MSKEVKRFIASLEGGFVEVVEARDYDALLAERDSMRSVLRDARQVIATALKASAPDWFETDEDIATHTTIKKIDAALQGAQP
ncbi:MAG: hypothetical protein CVV19_00610 [Gammaproteobacteria bacterium HGW-Gammaproteobacteria-9]|nr:MAG: hypothetical protein CVV19_00610 [Gammaproteobacteria bacterium HGW-Gammaproteobacteria-9]